MALPNDKISIPMVARELGTTENDLGRLCIHPNINMWAKRKPVIDTRNIVPDGEVGRGGDGRYGLQLTAYSGDDTVITTYNRPTGGASSPYRLQDFTGYDHVAVNPLIIQPKPLKLTKSKHSIVAFATAPNSSSISIGDLDNGELRLGVNVYQPSGALINGASASVAGGESIEIDLTGLIYNSLTFKFCLTDYYKEWGVGGGLISKYEVTRKLSTENKNWDNVEIETYVPPTQVNTFNALWNPIENRLRISIETASYSGNAKIQIFDSNNNYLGVFDIVIANQSGVQTFYDNTLNYIAGKAYEARLSFGTNPLILATANFTVFQSQ